MAKIDLSDVASLQNIVAHTLGGETGEDRKFAMSYCDKIDESYAFHGMDGLLTQLDYIITNVSNEEVKRKLEKIKKKVKELGSNVSEEKWQRSMSKLSKELRE